MKSQLKIVLVICAGLLLSACNKKVKDVDANANANTNAGNATSANTGDQGTGIVTEGAFSPADLESNSCLKTRVIYFDYDQELLKPEYQAVIACHSKYLRDRSGAQMNLEGNADERGTREYNLALGERRAKTINSAFMANAAPANRINVVSFGEERPLCLDSDESCWSKNRRVEIVYSVK